MGDVVVRSCDDCPTDYAVSPDPSPAQIRCSAYRRAVDVAKRWARHQHVDVWFAEGTRSFALLSRHRLDEPKTFLDAYRLRGSAPARTIDFVSLRNEADMYLARGNLDVETAIGSHPNVMLVGSAGAAKELITIFEPHLALPVVEWDPCASADPPSLSYGTVIVWNVDQMQPPEQQRLDAFVRDHWRGVQIVSVAEGELFDRVQRGDFLETLYYRLNLVRIHVNE